MFHVIRLVDTIHEINLSPSAIQPGMNKGNSSPGFLCFIPHLPICLKFFNNRYQIIKRAKVTDECGKVMSRREIWKNTFLFIA